jgi:Putative collagen-binding domain of a collagenase
MDEGGDRRYFWWRTQLPLKLDPAAAFEASWVDPRTGEEIPVGPVQLADDGFWTPPAKPSLLDWVLVLVDRERYRKGTGARGSRSSSR